MDASPFQLSAIVGALTRRRTVWIVGVLAATLTVALALASVFIGIRRIDGHLGEPLSPIALLATGAIVATAAAGARWLAWGAHVVSTNRRAVIIRWLPGVAAVALAGGVSLPGSSVAGMGLLWFAIVAEEVFIWRRSSAGRVPAAIAQDQRRESLTPRFVLGGRGEAALLPDRARQRAMSSGGSHLPPAWISKVGGRRSLGQTNEMPRCTSPFVRTSTKCRISRWCKSPARNAGLRPDNCCPMEYDWN